MASRRTGSGRWPSSTRRRSSSSTRPVPGETRRLPRGDLETYQSAGWFPDGKSVLVVGNEAGKASRCYAQDVSGGPPRPVTPEATTNGMVSPDGLQILYSKPGGTYLHPARRGWNSSGRARADPDDQVIRWSADGRSVYVYRPSNVPFRLERLDLASGRRELVREVAPADRTGVLYSIGAALTDDTKSYAYRLSADDVATLRRGGRAVRAEIKRK